MPCFNYISSKHAAEITMKEKKSLEKTVFYMAATNVNRLAYIPWYESGAAKV